MFDQRKFAKGWGGYGMGKTDTARRLGPHMHVLLIDDDVNHWYIVRGALQALEVDCDLTGCANGQEALLHLQRAEDNHEWPDVILLDVLMPIMDGHEFLARFVETYGHRQTPIIVMSGEPCDIDTDIHNVKAVVSKAASFTGMMELIRSVLSHGTPVQSDGMARNDDWILTTDVGLGSRHADH